MSGMGAAEHAQMAADAGDFVVHFSPGRERIITQGLIAGKSRDIGWRRYLCLRIGRAGMDGLLCRRWRQPECRTSAAQDCEFRLHSDPHCIKRAKQHPKRRNRAMRETP